MTPEQLEEIQEIGPAAVESIQQAVNSYYSQFEEGQGNENPEETMPEPEPVSPDLSASEEDVAEVQGTDTGSLDAEPGPAHAPEGFTETNYPPGTLYDPESPEERFEPGSDLAESKPVETEEQPAVTQETSEQFGTIEDAGSPNQNQSEEGTGPKGDTGTGQ
jgi:hypothetical protein